jgi:S1-C subfamily serine protease
MAMNLPEPAYQFMKMLSLGLAGIMTCGPGMAAELSIDQIRGLSNQTLCSHRYEDRAEAAEVAAEIRKRRLDCFASSQEDSGWDYTPEAPALRSRPATSDTPATTSAVTEPTSLVDGEFRPMDPEELANLQAEVQKEADRLQQQDVTGAGRTSARTASASKPIRPFNPPSGVVRISTGKSVGSGFYAKETLIVTNAHVVGDDTTVAISFSGQAPFLGQVVFRDDDLDFAIIETRIQGAPLPIRREVVSIGEPIVAMGFPQGRQVMASSTGTVVDVAECCILHDALIAAGNSGGPLLDARHEVLGLNTLLSKKPGDKANETDRAITVRMDFITRILRSEQARATSAE